MPDVPGFGIGMGRKGRVGVALPFSSVLGLASGGAAILIVAVSLILWPIVVFWTEISWVIVIAFLIRSVRKGIREHHERKAAK